MKGKNRKRRKMRMAASAMRSSKCWWQISVWPVGDNAESEFTTSEYFRVIYMWANSMDMNGWTRMKLWRA